MIWSPHYVDSSCNLPQRPCCIVAHLSIEHASIYIFKYTDIVPLFFLNAQSWAIVLPSSRARYTESTKSLQWQCWWHLITVTPLIEQWYQNSEQRSACLRISVAHLPVIVLKNVLPIRYEGYLKYFCLLSFSNWSYICETYFWSS